MIPRGYTAHEHLTEFGLINMNGRVYDPVLARFLSPDPYVQAPDYTQGFNRYAYCLNNPFKYTDPSGELFGIDDAIIIGFAIGAAVGAATYTASVALSDGGFDNWSWKAFWKSTALGAVSGAITGGIGSAFGGVGEGCVNLFESVAKEVVRAGAHAFTNGIISALNGGDFIQGLVSGGLGSLGGSLFQGVAGQQFASSILGTVGFSALAGGVGAELSGGDFWKGAGIGAMVGLLNHAFHHVAFVGKNREKNLREAAKYMEKQSKLLKTAKQGNATSHEVAGVILTDGTVLVFPENNNTETQSANYHIVYKNDKMYVNLNGQLHEIAHGIHTHPGNPKDIFDGSNPLGVSPHDRQMYQRPDGTYFKRTMYYIMGRNVYSVDVSSDISIQYPDFEFSLK